MRAILLFHNCEGQSTRQCPQTTTFEEKGELKQIRTEVPLLISLTPYRLAKPAHNLLGDNSALNTFSQTASVFESVWPSGKALG